MSAADRFCRVEALYHKRHLGPAALELAEADARAELRARSARLRAKAAPAPTRGRTPAAPIPSKAEAAGRLQAALARSVGLMAELPVLLAGPAR